MARATSSGGRSIRSGARRGRGQLGPAAGPGRGGGWIHWRAKAWENCAALAIANYPGPEYAGGSGIFTADVHEERSRELVADRDVECFLCTTVDTGSGYIREKRGLSWRGLQWYKPMVEANRTLARV